MKTKYLGILVAAAIVGLSFGDALTGHGIKGNKNLNPLIVGDGSSSSSSSTSTTGNNGGDDPNKKYETYKVLPEMVCTTPMPDPIDPDKIVFVNGKVFMCRDGKDLCYAGCIISQP